MCISTESGCLGRSTMVMVSRRNRLRRYFSRRQISLRVKAGSSWIGRVELACPNSSVKLPGILARIVWKLFDIVVHRLGGIVVAVAIDQLGGHAHGGTVRRYCFQHHGAGAD